MGYYLYVKMPNLRSQEKALTFFGEQFKPVSELFPWLSSEEMSPPSIGTDICAYAQPLEVGFYYGAIPQEQRIYTYGLIRWIALMVGTTQRFKNMVVPHYWYEGTPVPVVCSFQFPKVLDGWNQGYDLVDIDGYTSSTRVPLSETPDIPMIQMAHRCDAILQQELHRLSEQWNMKHEW